MMLDQELAYLRILQGKVISNVFLVKPYLLGIFFTDGTFLHISPSDGLEPLELDYDDRRFSDQKNLPASRE